MVWWYFSCFRTGILISGHLLLHRGPEDKSVFPGKSHNFRMTLETPQGIPKFSKFRHSGQELCCLKLGFQHTITCWYSRKTHYKLTGPSMSHNPTPVMASFNAYRWLSHYLPNPKTVIQATDSAFHLEEAEQPHPTATQVPSSASSRHSAKLV